MRVGTVLSYEIEDGSTSYGVVNDLIDVNSVKATDQSGDQFIIQRGQGHKLPNQNDEFCNGLRAKFGITVGPCQKETFGAEVVSEAKTEFYSVPRTKQEIGIPQRIPVVQG